jgi:hypothetical protein
LPVLLPKVFNKVNFDFNRSKSFIEENNELIIKNLEDIKTFFNVELENVHVYIVKSNLSKETTAFGLTNSGIPNTIFIFLSSEINYDDNKLLQVLLHELAHLFIYNANLLDVWSQDILQKRTDLEIKIVRKEINEMLARTVLAPKLYGLLYNNLNTEENKIDFNDLMNVVPIQFTDFLNQNNLKIAEEKSKDFFLDLYCKLKK